MQYIMTILRYILAALLFYTVAIKVSGFEAHLAFIRDIGIVPSSVAYPAAITSILVEGGVAILILLRYRWAQIWACSILVLLMLVYSYVVYYTLHVAPFVPCSCQGISDKISWNSHYWVNVAVAGVCIAMLYTYYRNNKFDHRGMQTEDSEHPE